MTNEIDALFRKATIVRDANPSREKSMVVTKLEEALLWSRRDDELRDIEGRCPVCAYHAYGVREGHIRSSRAPAHSCLHDEG